MVSIRADLPAWPPTGSARLTLSGTRYEQRVVNGGSRYALFGERTAGDYQAGWLPNGGYTLTVRPYTEADASGAALSATTVRFTVTGVSDGDVSVTGFTRVDPRGGAPDADVGPLVDGAWVDLSRTHGSFNVRAEVSEGSNVASVRFALSGPVAIERVDNAGGPYSLFGDDGLGDYHDRVLPNGSYTLTALPWMEADGGGDELPAHEVSFTVAGGIDPVTGFTRVDPRGGAPDADVGPLVDGATVDLSGTQGSFNVRAEVSANAGVGSVRFALSGPVAIERVENPGAPYSLFGTTVWATTATASCRTVPTR